MLPVDRLSVILAGGANAGGLLQSLLIFVPFIAIMYFLLIRPQRKKDKQVQEMRKSLQVGDEIITIGGICGKIVKTKDETIVIQVGAEKTKFEMMRWAISSISKQSAIRESVSAKEESEEEEPKKIVPKRLKKASADLEEEVKDDYKDDYKDQE